MSDFILTLALLAVWVLVLYGPLLIDWHLKKRERVTVITQIHKGEKNHESLDCRS